MLKPELLSLEERLEKNFHKASHSSTHLKNKRNKFISPYEKDIKKLSKSGIKLPTLKTFKPGASVDIVQPDPNHFESLKQSLYNLLTYNSVPSKITDSYLSYLSSLPTKNGIELALKETNNLAKNSSLVQACVKSMQSWQDSLGTIKEMTVYLSENKGWVGIKDIVNECGESLSTHILLSLRMYENAKQLKDSLKIKVLSNTPFIIPVENIDVFSYLKTSVNFLMNTSLASVFTFSANDPFMLAVIKEIPPSKSKAKEVNRITVEKKKIFLLFHKDVIEKLRAANYDLIKREVISILPSPLPTEIIAEKPKQHHNDNLKISKLFSERLAVEFAAILSKEVAQEIAVDLLSKNIADKYLSFINEVISEIVKAEVMEEQNKIGSEKAKVLQNFVQAEAILRNLIESEVSALGLDEFCEKILESIIEDRTRNVKDPGAKRRLTLIFKNLESDKLVDSLYNDIIEEFIGDNWLIQLATSSMGISRKKTLMGTLIINNKALEEAEDYALEVFTPGVHSPNQVSTPKIEPEQLPEPEAIFQRKQTTLSTNFSSLKLCKTQPISEPPQRILSILVDYHESLPSELKDITLSPSEILEESEISNDTHYFWLNMNENVIGLLVYSYKDSICVIHHVSCLKFTMYSEVITTLTRLIEVAGDIKVQFKSVIGKYEGVLKALKKKGFVKLEESGGKVEFEAKEKGKNEKKGLKCVCNSACVMNVSQKETTLKNKADLGMIEIGNRHCLISCIVNTFGPENLQIAEENNVRLQQDANELLEILISLNYLEYPLITTRKNLSLSEISQVLNELNMKSSFKASSPSTLSYFSLDLSLLGCTYVEHTLNSASYKFLRFKSSQILVRSGEDKIKMFIIPTKDPQISMFCIDYNDIIGELTQAVKRGKTDLFYNVDNLIKALLPAEPYFEGFWIPCFSKQFEWNVPWIEGFQMENNELSVEKCNESIDLRLDYEGNNNATLSFSAKNEYCISEPFVFGVLHEDIKAKLDSPLFVSLIRPEHWLRS